MKYILLPITLILLLVSCEPKTTYLTQDQLELEKHKVKSTIEAFNKASENKDFGAIVETLADEVVFFGTDSAEIIKSFIDFKRIINNQWEMYDNTKYGEIVDFYIEMDNQATLASVIFGVPLTVTRNGVVYEYFLRSNRTLRKKGDNWYIVSGVVGIARTEVEYSSDGNSEIESDTSNPGMQNNSDQQKTNDTPKRTDMPGM